ncbi:cytochrome c biogenesis protein CcdA [Nocardioides cavernae]|uniref:cytochrome c biogenesis CcdA family protein n=1 Tax=Nocardioides TaxID=1839 RepID=UPI00138F9D1F|nr:MULTISPECIES: cytochrome c biogenesis protein CcdA [Nocardioides]MCK9823940.1 cytochrome c biogenesis protein CcdA [Nocardioides cavernae]
MATPLALLAGFVSFFSPCILPLVPAYLSYATGLAVSDMADGVAKRGRMLTGAVLFVSGFGVVFVALGVAAGSLGWFTWQHMDSFTIVLGVLMILSGVLFLGLVPFRATPIGLKGLPGVGLGFAPVLGAMFAIVWLPCVGPVLGAILTMASSSTSPLQGGLLLVVYTIGFGLPFVAAALMWQVALRAFRLVSNHRRAVNAVAGLVMVGIGIAMLLGWWTWFTQWAQLQAVELFY